MARTLNADGTYTVKKGDTLSEIAVDPTIKAASGGATYQKLAEWNNIANPDYICVGWKLRLTNASSTPARPATNKSASYKPKIKDLDLVSNEEQPTLYATWRWDHEHTKSFRVRWKYDTGDGVWFVGEDNSEVTTKTSSEKNGTVYQDLYTVPSNAKRVVLNVKAISATKTVKDKNGKEKTTTYFTGEWSDDEIWSREESLPPTKPPNPPEVKMDAETSTLTATVEGCGDLDAEIIEFYVLANDNKKYYSKGATITKAGTATMELTVKDGNTYRVRCRSIRGDLKSDWTDYSDTKTTKPSAPSKITECKCYEEETQVRLKWEAVSNAKTYEVEYTTKKYYFDSSTGTNTKNNITENWCIIDGLDGGETYYFRVRAVNESGDASRWSEIKSTPIGTKPFAPTTWSSTSTVIDNEPLTLYWVHNSEDGSSQTAAVLELKVNGKTVTGTLGLTILNTTDKDEKDTTSYVILRQSGSNLIVEGRDPDNPSVTKQLKSYTLTEDLRELEWRVQTKGVVPDLSDFSVWRTVKVYARPEVRMSVTNQNGDEVSILESFPLYVDCKATPDSQIPIGYHISVVANEAYETVDFVGREQTVAAGQTIYSKYFDNPNEILTRDKNGDLVYVTNTNGSLSDIIIELSAGNIDLHNNISYTITSTVAMNSGLTASDEKTFRVRWQDIEYQPNAEIGIDYDNVSAIIRPYCIDADDNEVSGITLAVYRREFNGSFTEIRSGIKPVEYSSGNYVWGVYVTDPHPSLDYARYRIVAKTDATGAIGYYDVPGYPVDEVGIIIQWDEEWSNFETNVDGQITSPPWTGSLLRLPYNIDIADKNDPDVSLIGYIGREHPVTYYGTQKGSTSTWNTVIPKEDVETIYALRRLSNWMGDVYVREPSGTGYWANIKVSFPIKHLEVTVPVTFEVTRVEGGM